ncbi:sialoadhesin-like [Gopherus flavomarginatus]|uniref:sialoadhesin-like n=1 Tax=Gopherus flavomarginatus TaxID=286002 RepID=UPI0021CBB76D|nr:sialoadhesin-like [Gopherus flavomarginatus]
MGGTPFSAYAQAWGVTLAPGPLAAGAGSCVTIPCSFTYPTGWNISAVSWTRVGDQTVYHWDGARVHAAFKGRVRYLGDLQHNCSLRMAGLRPSDQGTYRFRFEAAGDGRRDGWTSLPGQQLNVFGQKRVLRRQELTRVCTCFRQGDWCQPSLGHRTEPRPSLTCSVGAACPHRPSWYDRDGARRSPGQTPGGAGATELRISPSQLAPGAALRCQVEGYWDECDSAPSQPLGTVAPNVPRVEGSWLPGKAALRKGDGFTLHCQAAALQPVAGYVWSRGDVWLPEAGQDLRVDKAADSDGGSYACGVWVSGPGWAYLSLSARESVEVQRSGRCPCLSPGLVAGVAVAILLLVVLINVGVWYLLGRGRWQAAAERAAQGAELSRRPKTESPYEELQGRTQDIYSQLVSPQAGSH